MKAGARLGPYEILAPLGAGGMGEVWTARDTRLDRIVAIKTTHGPFSERFEREARAISALNHPHICALYDVGEHDGAGFLVMELVEGAPLKGPLPLDQTLKYGAQICAALDAAHRKGIVHRDLKPDNILVTKAGVKLLDFGLAKLAAPVAATATPTDAELAATKALTGQHIILGTPQYMAPEQIEGRDADARTDIFAFGCVLYELATGQKAFDGKTPSSTMAAILATEPRPMRELQPVTPPALERIVKRCLAKDPDDRWQSVRDLGAELAWIASGPSAHLKDASLARTRWPFALAGLFAVIAGLAIWWPWRSSAPDAPAVTFEINPPPDVALTNRVVVSPDGRTLVAQARVTGTSVTSLMIRRLDSLAWRRLAGTEDAFGPTWSPDSQSLVFITGAGKVRRISIAGGPAQTLCDSPPGFIPFTSWSQEGVILFSGREGLRRVSAAGGPSTPVTALDTNRHETLHGVPQFLPDGRHFLYWARSVEPENNAALIGTLDASADAANRTVIAAGSAAALFAAPRTGSNGYMLFDREGGLMAQAFDAATLALSGNPFQVVPQIGRATDVLNATVSDNGVLVYATETTLPVRQLSWFDRTGRLLGDVGPPGIYFEPSVSPDDARVAIVKRDRDNDDIWIMSLEPSGGQTRLTLHPGQDRTPIWSPDGSRIVFRGSREAGEALYEKPAAGLAPEHLLLMTQARATPSDWSADGRQLAYLSDGDIWILADGKSTQLSKTSAPESHVQFSPDGQWIAYTSFEAKRSDVFVQNVLKPGEKGLISIDGGSQPRWRRDGKELFYVSNDNALMAVPITASADGFRTGAAVRLFSTRITGGNSAFQYSVARDGQRFLVLGQTVGAGRPITVVTNWLASVKK